jgi:hypothetical protein
VPVRALPNPVLRDRGPVRVWDISKYRSKAKVPATALRKGDLTKNWQDLGSRDAERLIAKLDDEQFDTREAATAELTKMGWRAEPALRLALKHQSPEVRRRAGAIHKRILARDRGEDLDLLRQIRALEALERIATPQATAVVAELAKGPPALRITSEARRMKDRLERNR